MLGTIVNTMAHRSDTEQLRASVRSCLEEVCSTHGGPKQFLQSMYPTAAQRQAFAEALWTHFPPPDDANLHMSPALPEQEQGSHAQAAGPCGGVFLLHIACFSFDADASTNMPPGQSTALALADEILTDGFLTQHEPLLVSQPPFLEGVAAPWQTAAAGNAAVLPAQSVGYTKGQSRMTTLLSAP